MQRASVGTEYTFPVIINRSDICRKTSTKSPIFLTKLGYLDRVEYIQDTCKISRARMRTTLCESIGLIRIAVVETLMDVASTRSW